MDKKTASFIRKEAQAFAGEPMAYALAGSCSVSMVNAMMEQIPQEVIDNIISAQLKLLKKWKPKDKKKRKPDIVIATAQEMGLRHTLRILLNEVY